MRNGIENQQDIYRPPTPSERLAELEYVANTSGCEVIREDGEGNTTVINPTSSSQKVEMMFDPATRNYVSAMLLEINRPISLESSWKAKTKSGIKKGPGRYSKNKKPKLVTTDY